MNVVVAELSSGKSAVNAPIDYILADIEDRDEVALGREREWKAMVAEGYKEKTRVLTRSQVRTIVQFLGEP